MNIKTLLSGLAAGALALGGCSTGGNDAATQVTSSAPVIATAEAPVSTGLAFQDMGGRDTTLDAPATKVFGAGPPATVMVYTFDAEALAGWNFEVGASVAPYLAPGTADLPVLGRANGKDGTFDAEALLGRGVEVIIDAGEVSAEYAQIDDDLEELSGIEVVQLSTYFDALPASYRMLGMIMGDETRGEELAGYIERINRELTRGSEMMTGDQRVTVYYATGDEGLTTAGSGNIHAQIIDVIGATNVYGEADAPSGRVDVNAEQLLTWNPDWIIITPPNSGDDLTATDAFSPLRAVADGNVIIAPQLPFGWMDGPPSVNQVIGAVWAAEAIYPDLYDFDVASEVKEFYSLFYHHEMTDDEVMEILAASGFQD